MKWIFVFYCVFVFTPLKAELIAYDLVQQGSNNLIEHVNPYDSAFTDSADFFQIFHPNQFGNLPEQLADESLEKNNEELGLITATHGNAIFAISDTVNDDSFADFLTASWAFAISGFNNLSLSVSLAAMGDFENRDVFVLEYDIDGVARTTLSTSQTLTAESQIYTLASGKQRLLHDPLHLGGKTLNNQFQRFDFNVLGTGQVFNFYISAQTDAGTEVFALQELQVFGHAIRAVPEPNSSVILFISLLLIIANAKLRVIPKMTQPSVLPRLRHKRL